MESAPDLCIWWLRMKRINNNNNKRKSKKSTRSESNVDKRQDSQIASLKSKLKKANTALSKPQRTRTSKGPPRGPRTSSAVAIGQALSEPTQRCLAVGTAALSPEAKGAYLPVNSRDSIKYDAKLRARLNLASGCALMIAVHPCPNSDAPSITIYQETTAGAFSTAGNKFADVTSYTNMTATQLNNDSMYTYASTDWDNAAVRYVGCGLRINQVGIISTRGGYLTSQVRQGSDPILLEHQAVDIIATKANEIVSDHRLVHRNFVKNTTLECSHLHGDQTWYEFNRTATNSLATNMASGAYKSCGVLPTEYGLTSSNISLGDPVILAYMSNIAGVTQSYEVTLTCHFERQSDDFARHHTVSHDLPHEIGNVLSALKTGHASHAEEPTVDIASHVADALLKRHPSSTTTAKKSIWGSVLKAATKPQNDEMALSMAAMLL